MILCVIMRKKLKLIYIDKFGDFKYGFDVFVDGKEEAIPIY